MKPRQNYQAGGLRSLHDMLSQEPPEFFGRIPASGRWLLEQRKELIRAKLADKIVA
jgi:hypothetical protein